MKIIEIEGGGFHPGIPASIAGGNCRVKLGDAGEIIEVVPLGQLFSDEQPAQPSQEAEQRESESPRSRQKSAQS